MHRYTDYDMAGISNCICIYNIWPIFQTHVDLHPYTHSRTVLNGLFKKVRKKIKSDRITNNKLHMRKVRKKVVDILQRDNLFSAAFDVCVMRPSLTLMLLYIICVHFIYKYIL